MSSATLLATAGYDHGIRFWEVATGVPYRTIQFGDSQVNRLRFSPDRLLLAAAGNPRISLFDVSSSNPNPFYVCDGHKGNVMSVEFGQLATAAPSGSGGGTSLLVSCSDDATMKVWDTRTQGAVQTLQNTSADPLTDFCLVGTRHGVSVDAGGMIKVWDMTMGKLVSAVAPPPPLPPPETNTGFASSSRSATSTSLQSLSLHSPTGRLAASCKTGTVFIYKLDFADPQLIQPAQSLPSSMQASEGAPLSSSSSFPPQSGPSSSSPQPSSPQHPTGKSSSSSTARADGANLLSLETVVPVHRRYILRVGWSADGKMLATAQDDGSVRIWTEQERDAAVRDGATDGHVSDVGSGSLPFDHQQLAGHQAQSGAPGVAGAGGAATTNFRNVAVLAGHQRWVWDFSFTPDSQHLFSASSDKKALLWDVGSAAVVREYVGHQKAITCLAVAYSSEQEGL
ncbi:Target of rapamycin complex subunit LST8 [Porphyridium purpureum]|uniref:Target of rapamycin complex subunit LST8 n=1 Tax=Porphyridium purpureum TaxID=35688 RepID=A0A5J4YHM7_PORPP|nr:Target of rapamycin complex subunit LST8 [Porphyridium purpureum]|eukprot:POR1642..scf270_19